VSGQAFLSSWMASLAFALSAGSAFWALGLRWKRRDRVLRDRSILPFWMRWLLPVAADPGRWLARGLPPAWIGAQARRIARCDLDVGLSVEEWIGLRLLVATMSLAPLLMLRALRLPALVAIALVAALLGWLSLAAWLKRCAARRERQVLKELPAYLDVVTLCVEAGATLTAALRLAVDKSPRSPLRLVFERVLREIRLGRPRVDALTSVARLYDIECLTSLAAALAQSEGAGVSLGGVLRAQSEQRSTERQLRAERSAMQAPVKMLGPLVLCVFPCTFIVIAVPVVARVFLEAGG
jgi:tight adherence protein C